MKHARASKLFVHLEYKEKALNISAVDDGVGFNTSIKTDSSGMETMSSRAALIDADFSIVSEIGKGTQLFLSYPYKSAQ